MEGLLVVLAMWSPSLVLGGVLLFILHKKTGLGKNVLIREEELTDQGKRKGRTTLVLGANIVAALSYSLGVISGAVVLLVEKRNAFVRWHARQSVLAFGILLILGFCVSLIPSFGWILASILQVFSFLLAVFLVVKAYRGEWFILPFLAASRRDQEK